MKNFKKLLLIFSFILVGCDAPLVSISVPTIGSSTGINPSPQTSTTVSQNGKLTIIVKDGTNQQTISNATVKVTSSNGINKLLKTDAEGKIAFDNLSEGANYNVEVSANGYQANSASTSTSKLEIKADSPVSLTVNLFKSQAILNGKVFNNNGQPIEAAIIKVGNNSGLSTIDGSFKVNVTNITNLPVSILKTGYKTYNYGNVDFSKQSEVGIGEIKLDQSATLPVILFDTSKVPFGNIKGDNINILSKLTNYLTAAKYQIVFNNFFAVQNLDEIETVFIVSPSADYSDAEIDKLSTFVKSGKKLVVLGEEGGYGGFRVKPINKLLDEANLRINPDIVKEINSQNIQSTDEQIITETFNPHFITRNLSKLVFYTTASVEVIDGGVKTIDNNITKLLSLSTSSSFRIQVFNRGQFGLAGVSTLGAGKVVVLGDSSIFTDNDSNDNGISNIDEFSNKQFALNILSW